MKIALKLYASLSDFLPDEARHTNTLSVEVAENCTVGELIDRFDLPRRLVHLVLVDGVFIVPEARATHVLTDKAELAIWPPIAGG